MQLRLMSEFCQHLCQYQTIAPMFTERKGTGSAKIEVIYIRMQINVSGGKKSAKLESLKSK